MIALVALLTFSLGLVVGAVAAVAVLRRSSARAEAAATAAAKAAATEATSVAVQQLLAVGRDQLDAGQAAIGSRLDEVRLQVTDQMALVDAAVRRMSEASQRSLGEVTEQLTHQASTTAALADTTRQLREALANPKARGQWGERMADDVLRLAGFQERVNYTKQTRVDDGRGIPDFTFLLPKGHVMYMDVKFPIAAYLRHLQAQSETERNATRAEFLRDVRSRVNELAARGYASGGTPAVSDVLLFIPNEGISAFIHEHDPELLDHALERRVVLCTPVSLFALLGVVRQAFDAFMIERTSDEVLRVMRSFHQQWTRFGESLDKVARQLETLNRGFDDLNGVRRRGLARPVERLEELARDKGLAADALLSPGAQVVELSEARESWS